MELPQHHFGEDPVDLGLRQPEAHAPATSPSLRDKGMSWVKKAANGDPPPVDCCIYLQSPNESWKE